MASPTSSRTSSPTNCGSPASSQSSNKSTLSVRSDSAKNMAAEVKSDESMAKRVKNGFSIQSILARPEPLRPSEHPMSYAHILQANFANYAPPKFMGQGMLFPWMPRMSPDMPENLSTKSFIAAQPAKFRQENVKSSQPKPEKCHSSLTTQSSLKSDNPSAGSRSPSPCASFDEDDDACKSPSSPNSASRRKKTRTVFSRNQVFQLESMFDMKRYLSSSERASLAASLNLSEQQIKIWFQNRRNKWKRQLCSDLDTSSLNVGATRFPPHHLSLPMYTFNGENTPHSSSSNMMPNLFCPHPMFMGGHLPFTRPTV